MVVEHAYYFWLVNDVGSQQCCEWVEKQGASIDFICVIILCTGMWFNCINMILSALAMAYCTIIRGRPCHAVIILVHNQ